MAQPISSEMAQDIAQTIKKALVLKPLMLAYLEVVTDIVKYLMLKKILSTEQFNRIQNHGHDRSKIIDEILQAVNERDHELKELTAALEHSGHKYFTLIIPYVDEVDVTGQCLPKHALVYIKKMHEMCQIGNIEILINQLPEVIPTEAINHLQGMIMQKQGSQEIVKYLIIDVLCKEEDIGSFEKFLLALNNSGNRVLADNLEQSYNLLQTPTGNEIVIRLVILCTMPHTSVPTTLRDGSQPTLIRTELKRCINDPQSELRRKLATAYELSSVKITTESETLIELSLCSQSFHLRSTILRDIFNLHIQKLIKQYTFIEADWKVWVAPISERRVETSDGHSANAQNLSMFGGAFGGHSSLISSPSSSTSPGTRPDGVRQGENCLLEMVRDSGVVARFTVTEEIINDLQHHFPNIRTLKDKPPAQRGKDFFNVIIESQLTYTLLEELRKVLNDRGCGHLSILLPDKRDPLLHHFVINRQKPPDSQIIVKFLSGLFNFVSFWKDKGLQYTDLNPYNISCSLQGDRVRVLEFSSRKTNNPDSLESHTLPYIPPEVIKRSPQPTSISWAIGCNVFFLIAGEHPWASYKYTDKQLVEQIAGCPDALQDRIKVVEKNYGQPLPVTDILKKLLEPDHRERMPCTQTEINRNPMLKDTDLLASHNPHGGQPGDVSQQTTIFKKLLMDIIIKKEFTPFDFWVQLRKCKGKVIPIHLVNDDGYNILHLAIDKGRLSLLQPIIHMGWWEVLSKQKVPDTSKADHRGKTPIEIADMKRTRKPQEEVRSFTKLEDSLTPIMKAARSGDTTRVIKLAQTDVKNLHMNDENGGNVLYWAAIYGDPNIFQLLLDKGVDPVTMRTKKQETLLHIVAGVGSQEIVKPLINYYRSSHLEPPLTNEDSNHKSPQDRFAENGDVDTFKAFIDCGLLIAETVPVLAAYAGRKNLLQHALEQHRMSVDCKDVYYRTPLHRAIEGGRSDIVKYLLDRNPNLTSRTSSRRNIFHIVGENGNKDIATLLLQRVSEAELYILLNEQDRYNGVDLCFLIRGRDHGRDAWHYVEVPRFRVPIFLKKTKSGNVDVAAYGTVIKSGWGISPDADCVAEIEEMFKGRRLDQNAPSDMTPLHVAIYKGNSDVAKLFLEKNVNVNMKDRFGLTPLMLAAAKGNAEILQLLESKGAKINELNEDGKSAKDIADENENDQIVHYIVGRDYYSMAENFSSSSIEEMKNKLKKSELEKVRAEGEDVRSYLINTLRSFTVDINSFLVQLDSGPVHQPTD